MHWKKFSRYSCIETNNTSYSTIIFLWQRNILTVQFLNDINVQLLNGIMQNDQDHLNLLRKIEDKPKSSQRELAEEVGFSLGKLNYCLKALKSKGLVKINDFRKNPNKINYIYVLTPKGISHKTKLTIDFMKTKMMEYDELKRELKK